MARPLAEGTTQAPRITVRVIGVERAAPESIVVRFLLVNPDAGTPVRVGNVFSGAAGGEGALSGICLADESGKKRYFVMRDDRDQVQCTTGLLEIPAGGRVEAWIRLAAPPAETRQVTVLVPGLAPFAGLPIADVPPGTGPAHPSY